MAEYSNDELSQMIFDIAQELLLQENKNTTAGLLAPRLQVSAANNRRDLTIRQVCDVIVRMAEKDPTREVTPKDIEKLYNDFYTPGTCFREEFSDLLNPLQVEAKNSKARLHYFGESREMNEVKENAIEVDLYSELFDNQQVIDRTIAVSESEEPKIRYAAMLCDEELKRTGRVTTAKLQLKYKTPDLLVYRASIRTVAGDAEVFIPVELKEGNPLIPQVMSTTEKAYTLDQSGIDTLTEDLVHKEYIKDMDRVAQIRIACGLSDDIRNDNLGTMEVDEFEFQEANKPASLGIDEIDQILKEAVLHKESKFDKNQIQYGQKMVEAELKDLGFTNSNISFDGDCDYGLLYKAKLNTRVGKVTTTVLVEAKNEKFYGPTKFALGEDIFDLSKEGFNEALATLEPQEEISPFLYSMSYPELKRQLKSAAYQKRPNIAKQVIALIGEKFDVQYYNSAIDDYQTWLEEVSAPQNYQEEEIVSEPLAIDVGNDILL